MNLRQMTGLGGSNSTAKKAPELPNPERVLTLVVEGAALGVPEIDAETYKRVSRQRCQTRLAAPRPPA